MTDPDTAARRPRDPLVLGVDLGTGGLRTALASAHGRVLAVAKRDLPTRLLPGGGAEQDPEDWWQAVVGTVKELLAGHPDTAPRIKALCFSAQWGGVVPVAADGTPTHPAVIWMDARGARYSRRATGGRITVPGTGYGARRLRTWIARTGGVPTRSGKDPVGQSLWLEHERPEAYAAARWLLDVPEYLTMRASGRAVAARDTAVLRWCTDNRDADTLAWDPRLARMAGLDIAKLPELVPAATLVGPLTARAAGDLGLPAGVQVVAGTGDTTAAALGAGAVRDHDAHLYVGTSAWLSCHVPAKKTSLLDNIASLPAAVPGRYWVATVQDVAGRAVDWLIENVLADPDHPRSAEALDRLTELAAGAPPGAGGVLFAPWLNGERTPVDDPALRGAWFNLSLSTTRADMARAVFEGIALNTRWMLEAVEKFTGRTLGPIRFIGGGATSGLWCQAMADVLDRPIDQIAEPQLANVRGAALLAGVALGEITWQQIPGLVAVDRRYEPNPAHRALYDQAYAALRAHHKGNRDLYRRLNPPAGG
ncbi:FGGY-family carbohydrate kinase [Actinospica sp.]|jgi:xylulokinase|uniref:xylulokinase n=1 Tax=Actinospica sp. TaxID=1872142 RepID=UPI002C4B5223|nr:FGGY-family carbohydrate kinase [Actinospica sp.]HWG25838.1 FGGY-family carbohydrate kinase [Actinospica sp.]